MHIFKKYLRIVLTLNKDIYDNTVIVIILDSIYSDFNTKIFSFFKINNKTINEIKQILYLAEVKNLS